ncbi:tRNA (adenosine(37)-N6)-threonylcarbamoyltransferase complex ATPase subunit type 1 TsaE [Apibacter muscae]|uniref:tRNA threonylcarbamoyladenosine biosynthesis protein TsaE n=1 Tax=Apibacter muscae TaxID=2509004 RepID=A0A563DFL8_9FLAO|nr:tRNA (adenosine(37)-N6)-threonylcarbamoyltransferase complex ATPase subunit type 1 TsaE [Apibacter muscae]TWP24460.1 tRNA (adenosine(37)-N6)-threonylcarbamoyltransferase complex ATPase subunit type 1 TsaE [Apibacter muscae]TWP28771.1 tRNA (adenosine(37)-N6)-threonylcarbamoyltransferase complex ATPase subunit type 1 TsaE [Apibacter muscae]TWP29977.1 tRNA (adenosine(37)-N6)-threonylcarbamoyltransferase complex ATPase subunit type 1 TsaE [Apibacter muscae]
MNKLIHNLNELEQVAESIITNSKFKIFTLQGNLGAGKTTLVKFLCKYLNCEDNITSPTFSLVNEYTCPTSKIYHFDLYRIEHIEELLNIGFHEYINSGNYCFIEWPEISENELAEHHKISLNLEGQTRQLSFS